MIRLVVNAEEFGTAPAIDRGILRAHLQGVVTSTSVAGNCGDVTAAHRALQEAPRLGIGLSLALIGGQAIANPADIPSLVGPMGVLRASATDFAVDWLKQAIDPVHVERELEAQIARALAAGLTADHLCTRGHLGFLPGVGQIIERLARRHHIPGLRTTVDPPTLSWITDPRRGVRTGVLAGLSWLTRRRLGALRYGPRTWGYQESGQLDEVRIMEILGRLGPGAHEIVCHPFAIGDGGGDKTGEDSVEATELRALTSEKVKTAVARRGILLCRWQDLF